MLRAENHVRGKKGGGIILTVRPETKAAGKRFSAAFVFQWLTISIFYSYPAHYGGKNAKFGVAKT